MPYFFNLMKGGDPAYGKRGVFIIDRYGATVSSGMTVDGAVLSANSSMYVWSQGVANAATVNGGYLYVSNGGTVNSMLQTFGIVYVYSGGIANAPCNQGGTLYAYGGTLNGLSAPKGATYLGGDGNCPGVLNGAVMGNVSRGNMYIQSGGTANGLVLNNGSVFISRSGAANDLVLNNGAVVVSSRGAANDLILNSGSLTVSKYGTATIVYNPWSRGTVTSVAYASVTYLERDADVYFGAAGVGLVSRGNAFSGLTISSGYSALVYSGGVVHDTIVDSGGSLYIAGGATVTVSQGSILRSVGADAGAVIDCLIGETAENWSGCTIGTGNTIDSGMLYFNGSPTAISIVNNVLSNFGTDEIEERLILSGITAVNPIIRSNCRIFAHENCVISGGTVLTEGNLSLSHSAFGYDIIVGGVGVSSATFNTFDYSEAYRVTVSEGGYVGIQDSSVVSGVSALPGGVVRVASNGTAVDVVVSSAGVLGVRAAGVASSVTVVTGGSVFVSSGGTANEATVYQGGSAFVSAGGSAQDCVVSSGGRLFVRGVVNDTLLYAGSETVFSGGSSINAVISRGSEIVFSGGSSINAVISSGYQIVSSGYTFSTVISAGSQIIRGGVAEATTATEARAKIYVSSGGTAYAPVIMSGASLVVSSGGTALAVTSNAGATVTVLDGGYIEYATMGE